MAINLVIMKRVLCLWLMNNMQRDIFVKAVGSVCLEGVVTITGTQQTFLGLVQNGDAKPQEISREDSVATTEGG